MTLMKTFLVIFEENEHPTCLSAALHDDPRTKSPICDYDLASVKVVSIKFFVEIPFLSTIDTIMTAKLSKLFYILRDPINSNLLELSVYKSLTFPRVL